jgi:acyl carrier protein
MDDFDHVESLTLSIFMETFNMSDLTADDDFFALGGDSALAVEITSRISERLGQHVPATAILIYPNARELTRYLREDADAKPGG